MFLPLSFSLSPSLSLSICAAHVCSRGEKREKWSGQANKVNKNAQKRWHRQGCLPRLAMSKQDTRLRGSRGDTLQKNAVCIFRCIFQPNTHTIKLYQVQDLLSLFPPLCYLDNIFMAHLAGVAQIAQDRIGQGGRERITWGGCNAQRDCWVGVKMSRGLNCQSGNFMFD